MTPGSELAGKLAASSIDSELSSTMAARNGRGSLASAAESPTGSGPTTSRGSNRGDSVEEAGLGGGGDEGGSELSGDMVRGSSLSRMDSDIGLTVMFYSS